MEPHRRQPRQQVWSIASQVSVRTFQTSWRADFASSTREQMDSVVSPLLAERTPADFGDVPTSSSAELDQWRWRCSSSRGRAEAKGMMKVLPFVHCRKPQTVWGFEHEPHEAAGHNAGSRLVCALRSWSWVRGPTPADSGARERESENR